MLTVQLSYMWYAMRKIFGGEWKAVSSISACFAADEVTRDYAYGETDRLIRKCVLLPWVPTEVLDVNCFTPEPSDEHYQV